MRTSMIVILTLTALFGFIREADAGAEDPAGTMRSWPAFGQWPTTVVADAGKYTDSDYALLESPREVEPASDSWNFEFTVYLWLPGLDLEGIVAGRDVEIDLDSSDSTSSPDLLGAFTGRLEAWHGGFGIIFDLGFLDLGKDLKVREGGLLDVNRGDATFKGTNAFLGAAWRFTGEPVGTHPMTPGFFGDLIGGARYYSVRVNIDRTALPDLKGDETFLEPVIGLRAGYQFGKTFRLFARAEAGGFGIGDLPDYDVLLKLEGRFRVTEWFELGVGYEWKWLEFSTGSGRDEFGMKVTFAGPWVGLSFLF